MSASTLFVWMALSAAAVIPLAAATPGADPSLQAAADQARRTLAERYPAETARIDRGAGQVMRAWRPGDGDARAARVHRGRVPADGGRPGRHL